MPACTAFSSFDSLEAWDSLLMTDGHALPELQLTVPFEEAHIQAKPVTCKRNWSVDSEFARFLDSSGLLNSFDEGDVGVQPVVQPKTEPLADAPASAPATPLPGLVPLPTAVSPTHAANNMARCGLAHAPAAADDDDDTHSVATLPMPDRAGQRGSGEDDDVSSANDLVEVPSTRSITTEGPSVAPPAAVSTSSGGGGVAHDRAIATATASDGAGAGAAASTAASPGAPPPAAAEAAAAAAELKAVLVAKVLTKSDATSKRIILPRITVEANLPQLATAPVFAFAAVDEAAPGRTWPLVVKAWANGTNPKPVYVLEGVGDLLKVHKLGAGDALGVLATADGRFSVAVNTQAVRDAAARPTLSSFTFQHAGDGAGSKKRARGAKGADEATAAAGGLAHQEGVLVCGRTAGCTRPAGHQGWCQGHGGHTRRRTK